VPVVPAAEAIRALAEACTLIRRMWTEDDLFDFEGRCYQLHGAVCEPKPVQRPHPPILIGGVGEKKTLRVVAEHADLWNCPARTAEDFRHYSSVLDEHCAAIGRDPQQITLIDAGATHLVLAPIPPWPASPGRWLADEVIEPVLAAVPGS
jgi:alkanesulfonate monooxygenase SsuD/methylene tetrahydromethanopterin reductase-like flavin-dependent oxidoreductase (luciferase family)